MRLKERGEDFAARGEVEGYGLAGTPVGGDLQDSRAAETAMCDENLLAEGGRGGLAVARGGRGGGGCDGFGGDAGEIAPASVIFGIQGEGSERGTRFDEGEVELASEVVAEGGCAHLRDGEAACGDDEGLTEVEAAVGFDSETSVWVRAG